MGKKFTIAGVTSGVGSMLIGAKELGFEVLGNVEWRNYYNTGTFEKNFNAPYTTDYNNIEHLHGADTVMVHDDCGDFSGLNLTGPKKSDIECQGKIPMTVKAVKEIDPNFFAMDNLPKMAEIFPAQYWIDEFPDYDIYFEWVSNHHYGNPQKNRKRFFIIGAKKKFKFVFVPGEYDFKTDMDLYSENCEELKNHIPVKLNDKIRGVSKLVDEDEMPITTWQDLFDYRNRKSGTGLYRNGKNAILTTEPNGKDEIPRNANLPYMSPDGSIRSKPGTRQNHPDSSMVITGGMTIFHHTTGLPLTVRERANIQGFPRDFEFILTPCEHWSGKGFRQVGKAMPVQFTTYCTELFHSYLTQDELDIPLVTDKRFLAPNQHIDKIKLDYCELTSYSDEAACESCWLKSKCGNYL
jgi:site-specific DNA-cytosine methylase